LNVNIVFFGILFNAHTLIYCIGGNPTGDLPVFSLGGVGNPAEFINGQPFFTKKISNLPQTAITFTSNMGYVRDPLKHPISIRLP
jgi:hypothetical protein